MKGDWMIWGPEKARIVNKFGENMRSCRGSKAIHLHHKQTKSFQDKFCQHVVSLVSMMEKLENLFLGNDETLVFKDIFACLFSIHNIISLSCHEQVCLSGLRFERYFSHHRAT